jgi:hypothetical protein
LGDGPGAQHAVDLEPDVVVEPGRVMLLDDETRSCALRTPPPPARFSGPTEVLPAAVLIERVAS